MDHGLITPGRQAPDPAGIRLNRLAKRILTEPRDIEIEYVKGNSAKFENVDFVEAQGNFLLMLFDKDNKVIRIPIATIRGVTETLKPGV